jgi:serine/threonine-protein kinase
MRVAGYRLEESIGQGGMAVVFRAHHERLSRVVALKLLAPSLVKDATARERFLHEAYAAAAVDHPHIVPVHDAGESGGLLFIATRFVPGGDLRAALAREPGIPRPARVTAVISPVASALDAAHQAGLVHRDIKPANILVDSSPGRPEHVYLADFGVSKWTVLPSTLTGVDLTSVNLTGTGFFLGTPEYSAPEQVLGHPVSAQTDQYALAVVAFSMLTGQRMFGGDQLAVMYAHVSDTPPAATSFRPQLPAAVDDVLWRALAKDPGDRYASCGQFADALRDALGLAAYGSLAEERGRATESLIREPRPAQQPTPEFRPAGPDFRPPGPESRPAEPEFRPAQPRPVPSDRQGTWPAEPEFRPAEPRPVPSDRQGTWPAAPEDQPARGHWAGLYEDQPPRPRPGPPVRPPAGGRRRRSRAIPVMVAALLVAAVAGGSVLALRHWHVFSANPPEAASNAANNTGGGSSGGSSSGSAPVTDLAPAGVAAGADYLTASQGPGNSLVLSQAPAGATTWNTHGVAGSGTTFSVPSVSVSGTTVRIAAEGPSHSLTLYRAELGSTSWSISTVAGSGTTFSAPSVAVGGGKVVVTAEGPNGSVQLYWAAIGTQDWHPETVAPAGTAASPPSVVVDEALGGTPGSGTAVAVGVHDQDHGVTLYWSQDGTSAWQTETITAPHTTLGVSSLTLDGTTLAMATEGTDHSLHMNYTPSPTTAWRSAGVVADPGTTYSAPSMAANGQHVVDVAAQGPDGSLLFYWARRGTSTWNKENVAGANSTLAAPSVAANGTSSTITAIGPGNVVSSYFNVNGAGTWQPVRVTPR